MDWLWIEQPVESVLQSPAKPIAQPTFQLHSAVGSRLLLTGVRTAKEENSDSFFCFPSLPLSVLLCGASLRFCSPLFSSLLFLFSSSFTVSLCFYFLLFQTCTGHIEVYRVPKMHADDKNKLYIAPLGTRVTPVLYPTVILKHHQSYEVNQDGNTEILNFITNSSFSSLRSRFME